METIKEILPSSATKKLLTVIAAYLITTRLIPSLLEIIGLPPVAVMVRKLRPVANALVIAWWVWYRAVVATPSDAAVGRASEECVARGAGYDMMYASGGFLDMWVSLMRAASEELSQWVGHEAWQRIASTSMLLLNDWLGLLLLRTVLSSLYTIRHSSLAEVKDFLVQSAYEFAAENIAFVRGQIAKEEDKMLQTIEKSLKDPGRVITRTLPAEGRDSEELILDLQKRALIENSKWQKGLVSGTVYSGEVSHTALLNSVYSAYSLSNPLHPDVWPSITQLEAEVISMTAGLLNGGDEGVVGATTSGGTESIVLAVRAAKEYYGRKRGVSRPEIICCVTAHAGLNKACEMFGIRLVSLPSDPITFEMNPSDVERFLTCNTILIYASAPSYPQGVIDPIEPLSRLAKKFNVGLHVDACLGGFVLPFARKLGYNVPRFDFGCPGVTSMSVDTHKYGYATKGTSVVLYRNRALRQAQYFAYPQWTGGLYATPTIAGSRSGALLACAWASLVSLGESGYMSRVKSIMECTQSIAKEVSKIPGLDLFGGTPKAMIVCFGSTEFDIYRVGDLMSKRGWSLNVLQKPACIHLCVTLQTIPIADKFVSELKSVVGEIRKQGSDGKKEFNAAVYGLAGSLPPGPVATLLKCYTDATLTP